MVHHRLGDDCHVLKSYRGSAIEQRMRARGLGHGNRRARRSAVLDITIHRLGGLGIAGMRGGDQSGNVPGHRLGQENAIHDGEEIGEAVPVGLPRGGGQIAVPPIGDNILQHCGVD